MLGEWVTACHTPPTITHTPPCPCSAPGAGAAADTLAAAQQVAAALLGGVTNVVLLEGLLDAAAIRSSDERQEVSNCQAAGDWQTHLHWNQGAAPRSKCLTY